MTGTAVAAAFAVAVAAAFAAAVAKNARWTTSVLSFSSSETDLTNRNFAGYRRGLVMF